MNHTEKTEFMALLKYEAGIADEAPAGTTPSGKVYRFADGSRLWLMGHERKAVATRARNFRAKNKQTLDNVVIDLFA